MTKAELLDLKPGERAYKLNKEQAYIVSNALSVAGHELNKFAKECQAHGEPELSRTFADLAKDRYDLQLQLENGGCDL